MSKVNNFLQNNKPLLLSHLYSLSALLTGFVICRYVFFDLHGMKEWPLDLLILGLVVLLISLLAGKKYFPWFASCGYHIGFWLGVIFHAEGFDPGGGRTDNLWQIWTIVFVVCILAGVVLEVVVKWRRLLHNQQKRV